MQIFDPVRDDSKANNSIAVFDKDFSSPSKMATKAFSISKLMSPPGPESLDSFGNLNNSKINNANYIPIYSPTQTAPPVQTLTLGNGTTMLKSDMISPVSMGGDEVGLEDTGSAQDPILFPESTPAVNSLPLFADNETATNSNQVAVQQQPSLFQHLPPTYGADAQLVVRIKSQVMQNYIANPRGWLVQQKEQLRADNRAAAERRKRLQLSVPVSRPAFSQPMPSRNLTPRTPKVQSATPLTQTPSSHHSQSTLSHPVHDSTKRVAKRANRTPGVLRTSLPARIAPQVSGALRHTPGNSQNIQSSSRIAGVSPEPRTRNSPPNREDKDFGSLPDYCPSLSTLPERTNLLKVEWKGTPLDLSHDPFKHLLHTDELGLAAGLRLDCATYLTSKRRIFIRRLECARLPKEFRKTDAQQACNIDVNKASKLWTAYDKVGWLRIEHIHKFL
ncbi:MAG: hypothetical protein STHCBS139747_000092 [Sporothrix thermara]